MSESESETITTWRHDSSVGGTIWMEGDEEGRIQVWHEMPQGPEPDSILGAVREAAWGEMQIPRNTEAALYRHALKRGLGAPLTPEFDFRWQNRMYRAQCYAMGITYCQAGRWGDVRAALW